MFKICPEFEKPAVAFQDADSEMKNCRQEAYRDMLTGSTRVGIEGDRFWWAAEGSTDPAESSAGSCGKVRRRQGPSESS